MGGEKENAHIVTTPDVMDLRSHALTLQAAGGRLPTMKQLLAFITLLSLPLLALAEAEIPTYDFHRLLHDGEAVVGLECHKKDATLEVGIYYASEGPLKRMDLWRVDDLVEVDHDTFQVGHVRQVERSCVIGKDRYRVRFVGLPGAMNANWLCGALMSATVTVWKNGRQVLDDAFDDNPCRHTEGIHRAVFRSGSDAPDVTRLK